MLSYVRRRHARGWSIATLGPNEARVLFDGAVTVTAVGLAIVFHILFLQTTGQRLALGALHPALFLLVAALLGVYGRLRLATPPLKAGTVLVAALAAAALPI